MTTIWYRPNGNFTGFVSQHQQGIENYLQIENSSVFGTNHLVIKAFDYSDDYYAAATYLENERWISFLFKNHYFYVTHYEIKQRIESHDHFMLKWTFEALNKYDEWVQLDVSETDQNFNQSGAVKLIPCKKGVYKQFRIRELKQQLLAICRIEIYGFLCEDLESCKLSWIYFKSCKDKIMYPTLSLIFILFVGK